MMSFKLERVAVLGQKAEEFGQSTTQSILTLLFISLCEGISLWARSKCVAPFQGLPTYIDEVSFAFATLLYFVLFIEVSVIL